MQPTNVSSSKHTSSWVIEVYCRQRQCSSSDSFPTTCVGMTGILNRRATAHRANKTLFRAFCLFHLAEANGQRTAKKRSTLMRVMRKTLAYMQPLIRYTMALQKISPNTHEYTSAQIHRGKVMRTSRSATARCSMSTTVWERCLTCLRMVQITSRFPGAPVRKDRPRITQATAVPPSNSSGAIFTGGDSPVERFMPKAYVLTVASACKRKKTKCCTSKSLLPFKNKDCTGKQFPQRAFETQRGDSCMHHGLFLISLHGLGNTS